MRRPALQPRPCLVVTVLASAVLLGGCSAMTENAQSADLCTQFDQLVEAADELKDAEPGQARADELRAQAGRVRDNVDQVQAVADGRLDDALSALEASLADLRSDLVAAGEEARKTTVPLVKEDLQAVRDRWAVVKDRVAAQCS